MDTRTKTILLWSGGGVLVVAGIFILFLFFRGQSETPSDVDAIYTDAALTLDAQMQTLQAGMLSATPNPALSSPTATFTLFPSPTLQQQTSIPLPTSTFASGGGAPVCDNSAYLSDVTIPDGTTIPAGQAFTKTWRVSNTGTCAWTAAYQLIFISGDVMGGKATAIGAAVSPGASADVSVALTAPSTTGNYSGTWRLSNASSQPFGTLLTVVIKTGAAAATATKTATGGAPAATSTYTFTPTNTPMVINTVPTNTSTSTPTPTNTTVPVP